MREGQKRVGLQNHPRSLGPLFCHLAQERHWESFQTAGIKIQRKAKKVLREEGWMLGNNTIP